ncbi:MAG: hypothetical protein LBI04_00120 [Treponema sp.]|nr:hypothetical protein [Treponema sp.]
MAANQSVANKHFPDETWVSSDSLKLQYEQMPDGATGIIIAKSKLPINPTEEHDIIKEITGGMKEKRTYFFKIKDFKKP